MLATLLFTLSALAQEPGAPDETPVLIAPRGSIQAPTQPSGRSSATYTRGGRFEPAPGQTSGDQVFTPIGSIVQVRGQEENFVLGIGIVTGLAGTGDSVNMTRELINNLLNTHNIKIDPQQISAKNVALVRVEGILPPGIQAGQKIDVRVSTMGDAKSIENGTLALTELTDISGERVYATAAGPINVGGFTRQGEGATVQKNVVTSGVLALGGKVERSVPSQIVSDHGFIYLDARAAHGSYGNMVRIADTINAIYPEMAAADSDRRTVTVRVPSDLPEQAWMAYLDSILRLEIEPDDFARVVVNDRSGVIVMGSGVRLRPMAVAYGNLTVTVAETPEASQPGPLSDGTTTTLPRSEVGVEEENNGIALIPGAVTLQEVVEVLNVLGTTPRDMINILETMSQAGMLLAEIQRM
jgi:flagellar P-ring protein precursor FlgI